jgi:apolipoprotein N-acyltransferase
MRKAQLRCISARFAAVSLFRFGQSNMNKTLSWFGTAVSIVGSFAVAGHFFIVGYFAFLLGSAALCTVFTKEKNWSMIVLQLFFLAANILGLYNALV